MHQDQASVKGRGRLRVGLVTPHRHHFGGVEYVNHMLASMFLAEGIETEFVTKDLLSPGVFTKIRTRLQGLHAVLGQHFNQHVADRVDVAICNGEFGYAVQHPGAIAYFHGCYYGYALAMKPYVPARTFRGLMKLAEHQKVGAAGKYVIAVSRFLADVLTEQGLRVDAVVDNAINTELFRPQPGLERYDRCLFVGSADYYGKGIDILERLADRGVQIDCITSERPRDPRLGWLGSIPNEQLPAYYAQYKALLLPSRFEGSGLVTLEAMACGTPVVMTAVGSGPDIAREIPEFVVSRDWLNVPDQIVDRLAAIEKEHNVFAAAGRAYVERHHNLGAWRTQWTEILRQLRPQGGRGEE